MLFFLFFFLIAAEINLQNELVAENCHDLVKEMTSHSLVLDARKYHPRKREPWSSLDRNTHPQPCETASHGRVRDRVAGDR